MQVSWRLRGFFCPEEAEAEAEMTSGPPRTVRGLLRWTAQNRRIIEVGKDPKNHRVQA